MTQTLLIQSLLLGLFIIGTMALNEPNGRPIPQTTRLQTALNALAPPFGPSGITATGATAREVGQIDVSSTILYVSKVINAAAYRSILGYYPLSDPTNLVPFYACSAPTPYGPIQYDLRNIPGGKIGIFAAVKDDCATVADHWFVARSWDDTTKELVVDGGFEALNCGEPTFCTYENSFSAWKIPQGGDIDLVRGNWVPHAGKFSVDLNGNHWNSVIYQDIPTDKGRKYLLTFYLYGNYEGPGATRTVQVDAKNPDGTGASASQTFTHTKGQPWSQKQLTFIASGPKTRISFQSRNSDNCCYGPAVDDVSVKLLGNDGIYLLAFDGATGSGRTAVALEDIQNLDDSDLDFDDQVIFIDTVRAGPCTGKANGVPCDDGNNCTYGDVCNNNNCAGTPVTCPADTCHTNAGTCDPKTGECVYASGDIIYNIGDQPCPPTPPCSAHACGQLPTRHNCPYKHVTHANADSCGGSGGHAMWTKFSQPHPNGFGEERWIFRSIDGITTGLFVEFIPEGLGRLNGTLVPPPGGNPNNIWYLNLELEFQPNGETGWQIKNELNSQCAHLRQGWWFYALRTDVKSYLVGAGNYAGVKIELGLERSGRFPVQVGPGASMKNAQFGLSTWLSYKNFEYDDAVWGTKAKFAFSPDRSPYGQNDGDINVNILCPVRCPPFPNPICGDGIVNGNEQCDGGPCCEDWCMFKQAGDVCRISAGACDVEEKCSGSSATCPDDGFKPSTETCASSVGFCDFRITSNCPGNGPNCPGVPAIPLRQDLITWDSFNLVSCLDFNAATGDIEGRAAVKRNWFTSGGFSVGDKINTGPNGRDRRQDFALVVGHNVTFNSGSIFPDGRSDSPQEDIFVGDQWNGPAEGYLDQRVRDTSASIGDKDAYFDAGCQYFTNLGQMLAGKTDNVEYTDLPGNGIGVKCPSYISNTEVYYLHIPATVVSAANWWSMEGCNQQAFFVLTISGTQDVTIKGGPWPGVIERTIINIPGTRNIALETSLNGNLLAPQADLSMNAGVTLGLVVVRNVVKFIQANKPNCELWTPVKIAGKLSNPTATIAYSSLKRAPVEITVVPVYSYGSWSVGDVLEFGAENCTVVGTTEYNNEPALLCLPPLTGTYEAGTLITATVQFENGQWPRTIVTENSTYIPSGPDDLPPTDSEASSPSSTTASPTYITVPTDSAPQTTVASTTKAPVQPTVAVTTDQLDSDAPVVAVCLALILVVLTLLF